MARISFATYIAIGVLNRRMKDATLETVPPLPPLRLGREGSFSTCTLTHCRHQFLLTNLCTNLTPFGPDLHRDPSHTHLEMAHRRAPDADQSFRAAALAAAPLLPSQIKGERDLQTVREIVGGANSEWGATRIWHGRTPQHALPAKVKPFFLFSAFAAMVPPFFPSSWRSWRHTGSR
jgi:hypothetical protein